jgi:chromosome segregation ATPase
MGARRREVGVLIEQAMYFALGFLVAGLLTLLFLPAFWRRAMRLSMRRLQMLAPMSMQEVIAERDLLRAEFAVRERRMEQELEAVKSAKAHDLAAIGRHAARVAQAESQLLEEEARNRDMELALRESQKTLAERTDLLHSTELALNEMTERAERGVERLRLLETDKEELGREKEAQYGRVVAHETKIGALHEQNTQLQRELDILKQELKRVAAIAATATDLTKERDRLRAELDSEQAQRKSAAKERDTLRAELAAEQERRRNETDHLETALKLARDEARGAADRLEAARADNAMLHGAVETLRAERAHQRRAGAEEFSSEPPSQADVVALRDALSDFGARVAELAEAETERAN